ncbi:hypothetical protein ACJJTC_000267 [Scirpophaga incertulas]
MGKRSKLHQEKLLRQRPNTFNSLSRTCSKTSQLTTIITKKNSSTSNRYYYSEGEYLNKIKSKSNIKLEVHVDLYPSFKKENRIAEDIVYSNNGQTYFLNNCDNMATSPKESVNPKRNESNSTPEITSLFHTIASHSKNTLKSDLDLKKSQQVNNTFENTDKSAIITTLEINKDLHEINSAIMDLSVLAGKALTKHLKNVVQQMATLIKPIEDIRNSNTVKPSILCDAQKLEGTQISYTSDKDKPFSGIKIAKSGKKRYEFTSNMKRKSSSYTIIKSESIINVTDMTKPAMSDAITPKIYMSLSKDSNTLHNQNVITYICDECQSTKTKHSIYNDEETPKNDESKVIQNYNKSISNDTLLKYQCNIQNCSSVSGNNDKPFLRNGLSFGQVCFYSILFLIPVVVIFFLFYDYVLKDLIKNHCIAKKTRTQNHSKQEEVPKNVSQLLLSLSDLGF